MKKIVTVCDLCGRDAEVTHICMAHDRRTDAAGGSEDVCFEKDVCLKCCGRLFHALPRQIAQGNKYKGAHLLLQAFDQWSWKH